MYTLVFSIIWTVLTALFALFFNLDPALADQKHELLLRSGFAVMPVFGLLFIWDSLRKLRRYRSVRCETTDNETVYVWTELNNSEKRSPVDPRIAWDKDDRNFADP